MKRLPLIAAFLASSASAQLAVRGDTLYTMAGPPIQDGIVIIEGPRIVRVGPAASTPVPAGYRNLRAKVVTPGLIDAHTVVGLSGYLNQAHDQDQIERSTAIQPDLRAIDAYNPLEELVFTSADTESQPFTQGMGRDLSSPGRL